VCQTVFGLFDSQVKELRLPDPETILMTGVRWGRFEHFLTPAYWKAQCWQLGSDQKENYRLGRTLAEEATACCLGGHGIRGEVGIAAFEALRGSGLLDDPSITEKALFNGLSSPVTVGGRAIRYRFPAQKASYLAPILRAIHNHPPEEADPRQFRRWFLQFRGVGMKTASWIARNWLGSSQVAIIDIHIHRAGVYCNLFTRNLDVTRDYGAMEELFLEFAVKLGVSAAKLDALIWAQARILGVLLVTEPVAPRVTRVLGLTKATASC
jgi:N-glycosylase/DNA lyase